MDTIKVINKRFTTSAECFFSLIHFETDKQFRSVNCFFISNLLSDKYVNGENNNNHLAGPVIIDNIGVEDFYVFNFKQLKQEFTEYLTSDYWVSINNNLEKYFNEALHYIQDINDKSEYTFYYLNSDYLHKSKLDDFFGSIYDVFIIVFAVNNNSIIRFTFGYD